MLVPVVGHAATYRQTIELGQASGTDNYKQCLQSCSRDNPSYISSEGGGSFARPFIVDDILRGDIDELRQVRVQYSYVWTGVADLADISFQVYLGDQGTGDVVLREIAASVNGRGVRGRGSATFDMEAISPYVTPSGTGLYFLQNDYVYGENYDQDGIEVGTLRLSLTVQSFYGPVPLAAVPLPASASLLTLGLAAVGLRRKRPGPADVAA